MASKRHSEINWPLGISHGPNVIVITKVTLNAEHYFIALSAHIFYPDFLFAQKNELKSKVGLNQGYNKIGYIFHIKFLLRKVYNSIQPFANSKASLTQCGGPSLRCHRATVYQEFKIRRTSAKSCICRLEWSKLIMTHSNYAHWNSGSF